jgi:hypothetical protein
MPLSLRRFLSLLFMVGLCLSIGVSEASSAPRAAVVLPKGVILVKGAAPAASDSTTPLPEEGKVVDGRYRNAYFGLAYPIPHSWSEQAAGPPPSDGGSYVLTQFALHDGGRVTAHVLVTAQDLFFSALPVASATALVTALRRSLAPEYEIDREPDEVKIAGRTFARISYSSPLAGLHWRILSTDVRCHAVTFTFTGTDTATLDEAERSMSGISLNTIGGDSPRCVNGYASAENVVEKIDPHFAARRFNTIPARIIVDRNGRVKHVHLLSAFPDQSDTIIAALRHWRFKPYLRDGKPAEVETGLVFGIPRTIMRISAK